MNDKRHPNFDVLFAALAEFDSNARTDVSCRWDELGVDITESETKEVLGSLLSRQAKLAIDLVQQPGLWTAHSAPLFLRAMADVHITLAWILEHPKVRSRQFIHYGLGQAKLDIEKRKTRLAASEHTEADEESFVEFLESWVDSQRYAFLTEVNVGSWSGASTRQMAHDAGLHDYYDYVYVPFSACVHSTWQHVERLNTAMCDNPLHRFHRVPSIVDGGRDPHYSLLAAQYLDETLTMVDEAFDLHPSCSTAYPGLIEAIAEYFSIPEDEV
ncbi:MAG: hypothetical protein FD171_1273 [Actinobacteria bacterium]|nr:MAG: hypothetical protein FD171_1273 [Actinomycetota bacterium]